MNPGEISLDSISRGLDDLQHEATHNRQVGDFILKQVKALRAEFDAQRAHLTLIDGRLDRIDGRLDRIDGRLNRIDGRLDTLEAKLDQVLQKLSSGKCRSAYRSWYGPVSRDDVLGFRLARTLD